MNKEDMKVGMLVRHSAEDKRGTLVNTLSNLTGIIIKLRRVGIPNDKGEIPLLSFPDVLWQNGEVRIAECQYLEVISEA